MKILIGYPPTPSDKGIALLSQNRQFQWFSNETKIFPVIPAAAATMLKEAGHDVIWKDCIAEKISFDEFYDLIKSFKPEFFAFETKTPVIKQHWKTIDALKKEFPDLKIILMGDHVTKFPEETMESCSVDYVICGGDFDFSLNALLKSIKENSPVPKGIFYRKDEKIEGEKNFSLHPNLDDAPFIDREFTNWKLYQDEYNIKKRPFMYIMSGRDCWHGKCTFCAWPVLFPSFRVRSVSNVLDEIGMLIDKYGVKEIFDDSGTLMTGKWLKDLCAGLIDRGYSKKITYSCNMRFGALKLDEYIMMKEAGFRLLKFGLESANQETLDRLIKGIKVEDIEEGCKLAQQAGLTVHLTMIVGYPWEEREDALKTFNLAKRLMQSGSADLLQATTLVPYPGTPLHEEALKNDGFLFDPKDYDRYDMSEPVLKTKMKPEEIREICNKIYNIFLTPSYIWQRIKEIKSPRDLKFLIRGAGAVLGHLKDFGKKS